MMVYVGMMSEFRDEAISSIYILRKKAGNCVYFVFDHM